MRGIRHIWGKLRDWLAGRRMAVVADPSDGSLTMNRVLFRDMLRSANPEEAARVVVVREPRSLRYCIVAAPELDETATNVYPIQVSERFGCLGFVAEGGEVARILYDYGLPAHGRVRLGIDRQTMGDGRALYAMKPPKRKRIRRTPQDWR